MENFTFTLLKSKIVRRTYPNQEEMQFMLDVFYMNDRVSSDEYQELIALLQSNHPVETPVETPEAPVEE